MKKSMTLLTLVFVLAAGAALSMFPSPRVTAQPVTAAPDDGIAPPQVLQGQVVSIGTTNGNGSWVGKVVSVNAGWITLDSPDGTNGKPIIRIPLKSVLCISSAK